MNDQFEQFGGGRLIVGAIIAIVAIVSYFWMRAANPITGGKQSVAMSTDQEIALGIQATPQLVQQYRGEHPSADDRARSEDSESRLNGNGVAIPPRCAPVDAPLQHAP